MTVGELLKRVALAFARTLDFVMYDAAEDVLFGNPGIVAVFVVGLFVFISLVELPDRFSSR